MENYSRMELCASGMYIINFVVVFFNFNNRKFQWISSGNKKNSSMRTWNFSRNSIEFVQAILEQLPENIQSIVLHTPLETSLSISSAFSEKLPKENNHSFYWKLPWIYYQKIFQELLSSKHLFWWVWTNP